jgi:hypothetical protein
MAREVLVDSFSILFCGCGHFELSIAVYLFQKFCGVHLLYKSLEWWDSWFLFGTLNSFWRWQGSAKVLAQMTLWGKWRRQMLKKKGSVQAKCFFSVL